MKTLNLDQIRPYIDHWQNIEDVYEVALSQSKKLPPEYIFVETGTRSGGSALAILQAIKDSGVNRWLFTIDPYGEKPYKVGDDITQLYYGEDHYRNAMKALADYAFENKMLHSHFRLKSLDWMRYFDNCEFWFEEKQMKPLFGFAYLDGDHDSDTVSKEYAWLKNHTPDIPVVVDDAHYLNKQVLSLGTVKDDRLFIGVGNELGNGR